MALGGACLCSEPLNTQSYTGGGPTGFKNPGDSTSKQCGNSIGFTVFASPIYGTAPVGMPAAANVQYVMRNDATGDSGGIVEGVAVSGTSIKRLCTRAYFYLSPDYQYKGGTCQANKAAQLGWADNLGANQALHWDMRAGEGDWPLTIIGFGNSYNIDGNPKTLSTGDCRGQWCRMELCASSSQSGSVGTGTGLYAEARVNIITGPKAGTVQNWPKTFIGDAPVQGRVGAPWIMNMYRQGSCTGYKLVSHAMQAAWTTDSGQWIGPAVEIEGNGNDVTPPAAPQNLRIR